MIFLNETIPSLGPKVNLKSLNPILNIYKQYYAMTKERVYIFISSLKSKFLFTDSLV